VLGARLGVGVGAAGVIFGAQAAHKVRMSRRESTARRIIYPAYCPKAATWIGFH